MAEPHVLHYTPIYALSAQYLGGVDTAAPHSWRGKEHLEIKVSLVAFQAWQTPASALHTHTCFLVPEVRGVIMIVWL